MEKVGSGANKTALNPYGGQFTNNAAQFIKQMNELSESGIQYEEQLNLLRLSNVKRLGTLRQQQEQEILNAAIKANERVIEQRKNAQLQALKEEEAAEVAKSQRLAKAEAKAAGKTLTKDDLKVIEQKVKTEFAIRKKNIEEQSKWEKKNKEKELQQEAAKAKREAAKKSKEYQAEQMNNLFGSGKSLGERTDAFKNIFTGGGIVNSDGTISSSRGAGLAAGLAAITGALSNFAKQLENQMDEIASKKSAIDTRLQGSGNAQRFGSYWDQMTKDITGIAGVSPLVKQSAIADRVAAMVGQGISFNVEQRATLDVLKDKIATTFDAANGTLLRLVKIQQQDTTAGRLGMESALTAFLNNMYETTEYMSQLATSVKSNLEEAMSLMTGENALSFEYQIQKWLGSLSSVGMSDGAVQGLAGVLGKVAAGQLDGITGGGQGNLVIMAANQAGLSMSDILNNGLNQETTNELLNAMVDYLGKIYNEAGNSKVIQQQIANVYGLSASDLKAAVNLSKSRAVVARDGLDYNSAMGRLYSMAGSMGSRTSLGEQLSNMWNNLQYSMAAGMANNPITYSMFKMSGLLKDTTGGINFGTPLVMGNGMPITFNVADLMRTGALAGGIMSSLGSMFSGGGGFTGKSILNAIGVSNTASRVESRGTGLGLSTMSGITTSESGSMVGNSSSDDITNKTMSDQTDSNNQQTASAVDESDEVKLATVDAHILDILDVLQTIKDGGATLNVRVDNEVRLATDFIGGL